MKHDSYQDQKSIKEGNRNQILALLREEPKTFTQLLRLTGFSPMGLTIMLKDLKNKNKITKEFPNLKRSPYKIRGPYIQDFVFLGTTINQIRYSGGKYYVDLPERSQLHNFDLAYGLLSHLVIDKSLDKKLNPFSKKDMFDIEKYIYELVLSKYQKKKILISREKKGKIILAFEIDYTRFIEAIETHSQINHNRWVKEKYKELELNA